MGNASITMTTLLQLAAIFGTAFVIGFSGAMMPGPLLTYTVTESARRGAKAGPLLMVGHMILEGALIVGLTLGLGKFLNNRPVFITISLVGGLMLLWMGQSMVRSAGKLSLDFEGENERRMNPILGGILVSLSNPYWTLWWATIGAGYVFAGLSYGLKGILAFFTGHILSDFVWYGFISFSVAKGIRLMSDRSYQWIIRLCGIGLVLFGLWFLWSGLRPAL